MVLDPALSAKISAAVDAGFDDETAFLQRLVAFPSTRGQEMAVQDFLARQMAERGYLVDRFAMDRAAIEAHPGGSPWSEEHSNAPVVVGLHHPRTEAGRSLMLQAHIDVVPTGPTAMWTHAPFGGEIDGDWLYGRGSGDMKAGAAANFAALDALRRIGLQPAATVYLQSVVEEESTGNGAIMAHLRGYRADASLIPEPEDEQLVRAAAGVLWFKIEIAGLPVHVRDMGAGANAIDAAHRVVADLRTLEEDWNRQKTGHEHFKSLPHPINFNVGRIAGGDWASSVPCWSRVDCRIAIYPGTRAADAAAQIRDHVAAFAARDPYLSKNPPKVTFNGFHAEGYVLAPGSDAEAVLARAHEAAIGKPLKTMTTPAYLDTRVHVLYDKIPALCYGPTSKNIHGFDEAVSLPSLRRITKAMALFIAEWCGVETISG